MKNTNKTPTVTITSSKATFLGALGSSKGFNLPTVVTPSGLAVSSMQLAEAVIVGFANEQAAIYPINPFTITGVRRGFRGEVA